MNDPAAPSLAFVVDMPELHASMANFGELVLLVVAVAIILPAAVSFLAKRF